MSLGGKTYGKYESFSKMIAEPGAGGIRGDAFQIISTKWKEKKGP